MDLSLIEAGRKLVRQRRLGTGRFLSMALFGPAVFVGLAPLVAAATPVPAGINWAWWGYLAQGILALGLVIFIHEFGHFAAAKLCGVKVEKFYIGFDAFGLRLFRYRWGETEYGIGLIPLGGYVYMLGQTDNPAKQVEEAERAKAMAAAGQPVDPEAAAYWDPRSYPAQTVPERMFIISAGVIMNAITAFLFAFWAYQRGVDYVPTTISGLSPGGAAWVNDLRIGDEITSVDGIEHPRFDADLVSRTILVDMDRGLPITVRRQDGGELSLTVMPQKLRPDRPPSLGVAGPKTLELADLTDDTVSPTEPYSPAHRAEPGFKQGDRILRIEDRELQTYRDVIEAETVWADRRLTYTVRRAMDESKGPAKPSEDLTITVEPRPMRELGLTMRMGPISAVQANSPAATAGLRVGDRLVAVDGEPVGDPFTLAERLRRKQQAAPDKPWKVTVERIDSRGNPQNVPIDVTPREANYVEHPMFEGSPLSAPTLGVAFDVPPIVAAVDPAGPAAAAGVKAGDVFTNFKTVPTDEPTEDGSKPRSQSVALTGDDERNWPSLVATLLPLLRPTTKIELTTNDGRTLAIEPIDSKDFFQAGRGLIFQSEKGVRQAESFAQAISYAWYDTRDAMTQVYKFIHRMWIGQIPFKAVGGVITIASQAGSSASGGFSKLLLFLTMLSCNLAVLNFLPFPVLDGGHMCFLIYEGIFRRPPPERIVIALNMCGLVCLLALMGFALRNDISRLMM